MVIRGRTRGNGQQLANYLLAKGENEDIRILDVDGRINPNPLHLHQALLGMSLTCELTARSDKGLYHAQINPAYGDDRNMTGEAWQQAADMLGRELGLDDQRRVIVLHTKKSRTHAHVVWERYDMEKGKMISDSFSRLAQDRVRKEMEKVFEQKQTPHRNVKRPEMKDALFGLWQKTKTGLEFIGEALKAGYVIAKGIQRRPFMVVDETGRSFDLIRQLDGINTKEVRERLGQEKLPPEKQAIISARGQKSAKLFDNIQEAALDKIMGFQEQRKVSQDEKRKQHLQEFTATSQDAVKADDKAVGKDKRKDLLSEFSLSREDMTKIEAEQNEAQQEKTRAKAAGFAENKPDITSSPSDKELKRQKMLQELQARDDSKNKNPTKGREPD